MYFSFGVYVEFTLELGDSTFLVTHPMFNAHEILQGNGLTYLEIPQSWPPGLSGMVGANMEMYDSDRWSNSSTGNAPIIPPTLNVEDWFQFFGIQGSEPGLYALE